MIICKTISRGSGWKREGWDMQATIGTIATISSLLATSAIRYDSLCVFMFCYKLRIVGVRNLFCFFITQLISLTGNDYM